MTLDFTKLGNTTCKALKSFKAVKTVKICWADNLVVPELCPFEGIYTFSSLEGINMFSISLMKLKYLTKIFCLGEQKRYNLLTYVTN